MYQNGLHTGKIIKEEDSEIIGVIKCCSCDGYNTVYSEVKGIVKFQCNDCGYVYED